MFRSIRARLTAWYVAIFATTFIATGSGIWLVMRSGIYDSVDEELEDRLRALERSVVRFSDSDQAAIVFLNSQAQSDPSLRIRVATNAQWIYRSPNTRSLSTAVPQIDAAVNRAARTVIVNGHPLRSIATTAKVGNALWLIEIGQPIGEYYEALQRAGWTIALASPLALLVAALGGYWMSRRALEPVDRIATMARHIGAANLTERLPLRGTLDELDRLSDTLNDMLARLEAAFLRVTQFTADASHELRTPVAIIRTTAEIARRRSRTEAEYVDALDRILEESERTTRLVEDLLLLARADADADGTALEPVDLNSILDAACERGRVLAEAAGLHFREEPRPPCVIPGDSEALHRLFLILFDNAAKYSTPGGCVSVRVTTDDTSVLVAVRDTGVGIPQEDLPHLFERFYRVGGDRARSTGGVGLGLSIARHVVETHHGSITVDSSHLGSTFSVKLPLSS
jgi:heavy metal sensor kinase